jgi:opacity protein-like surface antigen
MKTLLLIVAAAWFHSFAFGADVPDASGDLISAKTAFALSSTTSQAAIYGPTGFLQIGWGDTLSKAKKVMASRPGVALLRETPDELVYGGGTCAGLPVDTWRFRFENNNFYQSIISFEFPFTYNDKGSVSDKMMDAIRRLIDQKYGDDSVNDSSSEHHIQRWWFAEAPQSRGAKEILLNYNWQDAGMILTYTNLYYQSLVNPIKVVPGDL